LVICELLCNAELGKDFNFISLDLVIERLGSDNLTKVIMEALIIGDGVARVQIA